MMEKLIITAAIGLLCAAAPEKTGLGIFDSPGATWYMPPRCDIAMNPYVIAGNDRMAGILAWDRITKDANTIPATFTIAEVNGHVLQFFASKELCESMR